jgi:hypothetical protein
LQIKPGPILLFPVIMSQLIFNLSLPDCFQDKICRP